MITHMSSFRLNPVNASTTPATPAVNSPHDILPRPSMPSQINSLEAFRMSTTPAESALNVEGVEATRL